MRLRRFATRHPYWFVAILEIVVIFTYLLAGTIAQLAQLSGLWLYGLAQAGLALIALGLLTAMGWWRKVGYRRAYARRDLLYFIVPFLPIIINLIPGVEFVSLGHLSAIFAVTLMVGFAEESFFRGLMLQPVKAHGLWRAAIVTSVLFSLTHGLNLLAGESVVDAAAQLLYAGAIGFAFAALALKLGIIWPLVLAHFLIDLASMMLPPDFAFPPAWSLTITLGTTAIFLLYGLFVMLRVAERPFDAASAQPHADDAALQAA